MSSELYKNRDYKIVAFSIKKKKNPNFDFMVNGMWFSIPKMHADTLL